MISDKEMKKNFKKIASENPDEYYATEVLKKGGFERKLCKCGQWFWTVNKDQEVCGDNVCSGGFRFFEDNPCKVKLDYVDVWLKFAEMFKGLGYTPIKRYPVVARWRDDTDFVQASIYDFQPYVVSGEVEPPANPLVVPQFSLRFNDVDNVGITGSHFTCFNMIGQHMFVSPDVWDQNRVFSDIKKWLNDGLGIPDTEITFHEDAWAGGGNYGPCMEYFCRGVELGNQVYMLFEQTEEGSKGLKLKVLDMGMGMERNAWFSQATPTAYDATFPTVVKKLLEVTKIEYDESVMAKFVPHAGALNIDEVDNIEESWKQVAEKVGVDVNRLKEVVIPMSALYSIAEHARCLLIALADGALPSNVGGSYNLRMLARRAFGFIDKYKWDLELIDVCKWHAEYLKPAFPELLENFDLVENILTVEKEKYKNTKTKSMNIVKRLLADGAEITEEKLLDLYDSDGVNPDLIKEEAKKLGKTVVVPDDFYVKLTERHSQKEQAHATKKQAKIDFGDVQDTKALYFDNYLDLEFEGKVLAVVDDNVVFDKTIFYPTSGGQLHDIGSLEIAGKEYAINDVFKQGGLIVHKVASIDGTDVDVSVGDSVKGSVEKNRRIQLTQHHTLTHIIGIAARKVLGRHINQAGAKKTVDKAHLDITHYRSVSDEELREIEKEAKKIIKDNHSIKKYFLTRTDAEQKFGMAIYQGGAVPGKMIRIVEIPDLDDAQACGGTHLDNTSEVGDFKILKSTKIQDGIVRIVFVAGFAAAEVLGNDSDVLNGILKELDTDTDHALEQTRELFKKWKSARKAVKKKKTFDADSIKDLQLESKGAFKESNLSDEETAHLLKEMMETLKTQKEHLANTVKKFKTELDEMIEKLKE